MFGLEAALPRPRLWAGPFDLCGWYATTCPLGCCSCHPVLALPAKFAPLAAWLQGSSRPAALPESAAGWDQGRPQRRRRCHLDVLRSWENKFPLDSGTPQSWPLGVRTSLGGNARELSTLSHQARFPAAEPGVKQQRMRGWPPGLLKSDQIPVASSGLELLDGALTLTAGSTPSLGLGPPPPRRL